MLGSQGEELRFEEGKRAEVDMLCLWRDREAGTTVALADCLFVWSLLVSTDAWRCDKKEWLLNEY